MNDEDITQKIQTKYQIYKEELEKLFKQNNDELTANSVVESAKEKTSPLHDYFEWNDSIAGEMWRLHQARKLFGHIKIDVKIEEHVCEKVNMAVQVMNKQGESVYVPILKAREEPNYCKQLIEEIQTLSESLNKKIKLFIFKS